MYKVVAKGVDKLSNLSNALNNFLDGSKQRDDCPLIFLESTLFGFRDPLDFCEVGESRYRPDLKRVTNLPLAATCKKAHTFHETQRVGS